MEGRVVFERRILDDKKDGRQTSSEVKPGRAGLVLGWVTSLQREAAVMINTTPSHRLGLLFAFFFATCAVRSLLRHCFCLFLFCFLARWGWFVVRRRVLKWARFVCLFVCLFFRITFWGVDFRSYADWLARR